MGKRDIAIAISADAAALGPGLQQAQNQTRQFAAETARINAQLEQASSAYAKPQTAQSLLANEAAMNAAMLAKRQDAERTMLRERMAGMERAAAMQYNLDRRREQQASQTAMRRRMEEYYFWSAQQDQGGPGLIQAMGGKRLLKNQMKYAAGTLAGMHGGEVGMASMAALSFTPIVGAAVGGLILMGSLYHAATEKAKALKDEQERYNKHLKDSVAWAKEMADLDATPLSRSLREQSQKHADEARRQREAVGSGEMGFLEKLGFGGMGDEVRYARSRQHAAQALGEEKAAARLDAQAAAEEVRNRQRAMDDAVTAANVAEMESSYGDSPSKRRAMLAARQQQEADRMERGNADRLERLTLDTSPGASQRLSEEMDRQAAIRYEQQRKFGYQQNGLEQQLAYEQRQEQGSAEDARINATMEGYAREEALLKAKHARELDERTRAGTVTAELLQRQQAEQDAIAKRRNQAIADMQQDMEAAAAVARGDKTSGEAEWEAKARQLSREYSMTADELERMHAAFIAMKQAQADKGLLDNAKEIAITLDRVNRKISEQEALRRRLQLANPEASSEAIQKAAEAQEKLQMTQWVKGQLPVEQFKDYRENLERAVEMNLVGKHAAAGMLQKKMNELLGGDKLGQFTDSAGHWRSIQSSLIRKDDLPRLTVEELQKIREEISRLRKEGAPLKG